MEGGREREGRERLCKGVEMSSSGALDIFESNEICVGMNHCKQLAVLLLAEQ